MNAMERYENATVTATTGKGLNSKQLVWFHCFNPNGLCAVKRANDDVISKLADATGKTGHIMVYGTFSDFEYMEMFKLNSKNWKSWTQVMVAVEMLTCHTKKQAEKIDELGAFPTPV